MNNSTNSRQIKKQQKQPSPVRRGLAGEFCKYLIENKKWWMIPILAVILLMAALLVFGGSALAPFIYTLF